MGSLLTSVNITKVLAVNYVSVSVILSSIFIPTTADAGVFSFISNIFTSKEVKAEEVESNSQNMPLLQATISLNLGNASTTKEIFIVEGNSLSPEQELPDEVKTVDSDQISVYVVRSGDTLPAIAKMFGVSVNTIRWGNDIKGNSITPGQTLVILPISGIQHVVKSGDTLQSIAKQHKGDLDEILQYNNLTKNSKLTVGDVILVPDGEAVSSGTTGGSKPTPAYPIYEGYYMRPIIGGVKTQGVHGHNGVDLALSYGSNILASADGEVLISRSSGWNGGYGSYIVIKHGNGTQTLYAHLSGTAVVAGQSVKQGQVIGYMGRSGSVRGHTGIHLHFEIRGARNPF